MSGDRIAKVAVSSATYSIDKPYDYLIPASMAEAAGPGIRVMIPFGRGNRRCEGVILAVDRESGTDRALKAVDELLDSEPVLDEGQLRLALWMRDRFFCTVYDALHAMLPAGIWYRIRYRYALAEGANLDSVREKLRPSSPACALLDYLAAAGGAVDEQLLKRELGDRDVAGGLRRLVELGAVLPQVDEQRQVRDKLTEFARLAIPADEAAELAHRKQKSAKKQSAVLALLVSAGEASSKEIGYFTGATGQTLRAMEKVGLITLERREVLRRPEISPRRGPAGSPLTGEQREVCEGLIALYEQEGAEAALLHGVTGSGKTAVYLHLIDRVMQDGKTAIVLVPEIALTPQLMGTFAAQFGDRAAVLHSALGMGERYDEWKRIRGGGVGVVVGTRSAVFAPLKNIGAIVIDEEQEYTYKSENSPRYHARDVAKYRCAQEGALLVLGSATPAVETTYGVEERRYHYFGLSTRYNRRELPRVIIADMREELRAGGGTNIGRALRVELEKNLEAGEQSILFINRRGTSNLLACGECGFTHTCERCSVSLTYHRANRRLMCHYCGASRPVAELCPECGGIMKHVGAGTQKIEEELEAMFPGTGVLRMDTDTITPSTGHDALLTRFEREKIPILVGTQMVTKGLDFPGVTLVGVISADQALYAGDFRAQERTFSLITQVVGRAGRGDRLGRAVIQTFTPEHEVIALAAAQDYGGFYRREITLRELMGVPPIRDLVSITCTGLDERAVMRCAADIKRTLQRRLGELDGETEVVGPAPAGIAKINNRYRYHVTIRCKNSKVIRELVSGILRRIPELKHYRGVSVYGDVNAFG